MKLKKLLNKKDENKESSKFCKKCGVELVSTNKSSICDNCKGKSVSFVKKVGVLVGTAFLTVLYKNDKD